MSNATGATKTSTLLDRPDSYGWISIGLHWLVAIIVTIMWFVGKSISTQPPGDLEAMRQLHVTLGLSAWLLLAGRIVWRLRVPHPRASGQSWRLHRIVRSFHYLMLIVLGMMLFSGPVLAGLLAAGNPAADGVRFIHATAANVLFLLVLVHILGALKHLMFHHDETIERMLWPKKPGPR